MNTFHLFWFLSIRIGIEYLTLNMHYININLKPDAEIWYTYLNTKGTGYNSGIVG